MKGGFPFYPMYFFYDENDRKRTTGFVAISDNGRGEFYGDTEEKAINTRIIGLLCIPQSQIDISFSLPPFNRLYFIILNILCQFFLFASSSQYK